MPFNLDMDELRRLKNEGLTTDQIAKELHVSYCCASNHLRKLESIDKQISDTIDYLNNLSEYQKVLLSTNPEFNKFIYKINEFKADSYNIRSRFTKDEILELKALILSAGYKYSHGDIIFNINHIGIGRNTRHFNHLDFEKEKYRCHSEHSKKIFTDAMEKYKGITFEQFLEHPLIRLLYIPFPPDTFNYVNKRRPIKCG